MARTALLRPLEREVQRGILDYLATVGVLAWRNNTGAMVAPKAAGSARRFVRFGLKGSADILGVLGDGRLLAIEVKRPGERPTADQLAFLRAVLRSNGVAFWADRVEAVATVLDRLREGWRVELDDRGDPVVTDDPPIA